MSDLIDRQALLKQIDIDSDGEPGYYGDTWKFIDTIKNMPNVHDLPKDADTISRQAAIDGKISVQRTNGVEIYSDDVVPVKYLENLPSAQPEIIYCKDCKWWDKYNDNMGYCMAARHTAYSTNWEIQIRRTYKGDFYCAHAELEEENMDEVATE